MRVGVRVNRADAFGLLTPHLPPGWKASSSPLVDRLFSVIIGDESPATRVRRFNLLYEDHVRMARTRDPAEVLDVMESRVRLFVAERARRRIFVHAGAVGWRGRAILIPGRSMSGKSTLVAEFVRAGATYYSDEFAVIDERGRVHPFAKPISLRRDGETRQENFRIEELGARAGTRPLPVGLVLSAEYRAGARWRPKALSSGQGVLALLSHVVAARSEPARALAYLEQVVERAPVIRGRRGEAHDFARKILAESLF
ncbi:MAG TPA: hypothetical protein VGA87_02015 [Pyrinomonadaceae bacterium]